MAIPDLLDRYHQGAVSRGLRPRSIAHAEKDLRRVARDLGARCLGDVTPTARLIHEKELAIMAKSLVLSLTLR